MKLYLLIQNINNGFETYNSVVVCAESEEDARTIHPSAYVTHVSNNKWMGTYTAGNQEGDEYEIKGSAWVSFEDIGKIEVACIGEAAPSVSRGVILASYNAV